MQYGREFVEYALRIGAIELLSEGRALKSGRISPYFFNSGLFNRAQDLLILGKAYAEAVAAADDDDELMPQVIYGPAYKGISLAIMTATTLTIEFDGYSDLGVAFNRKEAKDHGEGGIIIGSPLDGKRVLIADDVTTNGDSKREAVEIICSQGGIPVGCVIAFDRQERGADPSDPRSAMQVLQEQLGIPMIAVATLEDLISVLRGSHGSVSQAILPKILAYREQYGVS